MRRIALGLLLALLVPLALHAQGLVGSSPAPTNASTLSSGTLPAARLPMPIGVVRIGAATSVNLASLGDQATITVPTALTKYAVSAVWITNCSTTPILAQVAVFTGAGGTGTTVLAAGTIAGATSASVILAPALAGTVATTALTAGSLFVRVAVVNALALTCDVHVFGYNLS